MLRLSQAYPLPDKPDYWHYLVFFDIETTGFHRRYHQVGLISLAYLKDEQLQVIQYFAEDSSEEGLIITSALREINQQLAYVSYNGDRFDIPFLNQRSDHLQLGSRLEAKRSIDLYRLRGKDRLKQTESDSGFDRQDDISGAEWAELYQNYLKQPDLATRERLLLHCRDDILSLVQLLDNSADYRSAVQEKLVFDPPGVIEQLIASPGNLRVHLIDQANQSEIIDFPLVDTPHFSILDDPSFDQLEPAEKQQLVLIEHGHIMKDRVHYLIQRRRAAD